MFLILCAAMLGGMASMAVLTPYSGVLVALGAAPLGGSLLAVVAGAFLACRAPGRGTPGFSAYPFGCCRYQGIT